MTQMISFEDLSTATEAAVHAIPPAFPLSATVAVNPFLGQSTMSLAETSAQLGRVAGCGVTAPRAWFRAALADGTITDSDIAAALEAAGLGWTPSKVRRVVALDRPAPTPLATVADLAAQRMPDGWAGHPEVRIGAWATGYFDAGQSVWSAQQGGAFASWAAYAKYDTVPDLSGVDGAKAAFAAVPVSATDALMEAVERLGLPEAALEAYFHRALMSLGGWAQAARYKLWQADLAGGTDTTLADLLAVRVIWDAVLLQKMPVLATAWAQARTAFASPAQPSEDDLVDSVLQDAAERAVQRGLAPGFAGCTQTDRAATRPALQAAFCIDVRSEVMRRALESLSSDIETIGFAGFFGLTVAHRPAGAADAEARLPVLLSAGLTSAADADHGAAQIAGRATRAWGRFRQAAVSSFAFVEATGPVYAGKLVADALGLNGDPAQPEKPVFDPPLPIEAQIDAAETILNAMSLKENFAPIVLIAGHGSHVSNNAHASALQCGACGGYGGDVNARLLADVLNTGEVRTGLADRGIVVPDDTVFVAALHDTAQDSITLFEGDLSEAQRKAARANLARAEAWCAVAGQLARAERAASLPGATGEDGIAKRAQNWAETRPEWGLAGCRAFVVAPRDRTARATLDGKVFLHSYNWRQDEGFKVLELILTAPVVVASWISLQYFGSVVAPDVFGGGTKQVHNVSGGMGVLDGASNSLRVGLPLQSVHDGTAFRHDPVRLSVVVDAPAEAITAILAAHPGVKALFDNGWLRLLRLSESGGIADRYVGDLAWEPFLPTAAPAIAAR